MSRFPLYDLARDATLAVGAYVGILREHVKTEWATVLGGSFDERVAEARARMEAAADMLADKEAEEEVTEPWAPPTVEECRCPSCLDVLQAEQESSPKAEAAVGEPRSGLSTPPAPAPGTNVGIEPDDPLAKAIQASITNPDSRIACIVDGQVYHLFKVNMKNRVMTTEWLAPMEWKKFLLPVPRPDVNGV